MSGTFNLEEDFITLGQLLKLLGVISTGGMAKWFLSEYTVIVNNEKEDRRGRKLYEGDKIDIENYGEIVLKR